MLLMLRAMNRLKPALTTETTRKVAPLKLEIFVMIHS
jgi:hypothetical protein